MEEKVEAVETVTEPVAEVIQEEAPVLDPPPKKVQPVEKPALVLTVDAAVAQAWLHDARWRVRWVFDEIHVTGEGLGSTANKANVDLLLLKLFKAAIKPDGVVFVPESIVSRALEAGLERSKRKAPKGFFAFT